ncbi:MAG: hypothetical protein R3350_10125 [Saprospiraceae bacterium]|nr:hypothetical protein [Saprospiraceae bacterium]
MKKNCLECGQTVRGRADKKYCCSACRNARNNRLNRDCNNTMRTINNILRRNRRILSRCCADGHLYLHRFQLAERGFDFRFFTHERKVDTGRVHRFCYDFGYWKEGDKYRLVAGGKAFGKMVDKRARKI